MAPLPLQVDRLSPGIHNGKREHANARGSSPPAVEHTETVKMKKKEAQRQACFDNTIKDQLKLPNNYLEANVLMIRWAPEIDAFAKGHNKEIADLKQVFTNNFGFSIASEVHLSNKKQPQNALNNAITQLVADHDGPNKLLIVYYTGHGMLSSGEQDLTLTATDDVNKNQAGNYPASACWATAERPLLHKSLEADVLVILDCCFASNAHKGLNESTKIYELLAACPRDEPTVAPGDKSFTRRLINSLKSLVGGHKPQRILTTKLLATLNKHPGSSARLHDRLHSEYERHVQLTPIVKRSQQEAKEEAEAVQARLPELAAVKLRFSLQERELSQQKIENWAKELLKASKEAKIPIRQIDWVKMSETGPRDPKATFRHVVKEALKDSRRRSWTSEALRESTAMFASKRPSEDDELQSPSKRLAHCNESTPEAQETAGLLTPRPEQTL